MRFFIPVALACACVAATRPTSAGVTLDVSATASPYLAGMPVGSTLPFGDSAPSQSPAEVLGLPFSAGDSLRFSASGSGSYNASEYSGPDGLFTFSRGSANGISGYTVPVNSLLGVFLGPERPDGFSAPASLDFGATASRDYLSLSPELRQVFFIGDGLTSSSVAQKIVVPAGATRLFLGFADGSEWRNNGGSFRVVVDRISGQTAIAPEPLTLASAAVGVLSFALLRRNRRESR